MAWDDFRYFLAVSEGRTLRNAARALRVDQATVGRRLAALQAELGVVLLEKRSDGFFPTPAGDRIRGQLASVEATMLSVRRMVAGRDERLEGVVKAAMPGALANRWILPALGPLLDRHPGLEVEFLTGPELLNLSRREADFAIRLVRPEQRELKAKKIGELRLALYGRKGSRTRWEKNPETLPFLGLFDSATSDLERRFLKSFNFTPQYRIRSNSWESVHASLAGGGIGILPAFFGDADPQLERLGPESAATPLWLVVHPEVAQSARVRVVIDFLVDLLQAGHP